MRQILCKRLRQMEEVAHARQQRNKKAGTGNFQKKISVFLHLRGVEKQAHESLAGALCRALEIDGMELKRQLTARIDPIHKYFTDNGIYEEIQKELQKRKTAGTMPGG